MSKKLSKQLITVVLIIIPTIIVSVLFLVAVWYFMSLPETKDPNCYLIVDETTIPVAEKEFQFSRMENGDIDAISPTRHTTIRNPKIGDTVKLDGFTFEIHHHGYICFVPDE